ncbi:TM2 domain-containing protein [Aestuariivivens sp. NBU2969]|uniref:TM2 domain-containing protein n=1 Tax=Aestuariivivens sp. NBU2969 TaxID=2873267 RepID=UPI001CBE5064|nr:TM2 domain-containing protein [Aestuariivivens sp. NBU2969]
MSDDKNLRDDLNDMLGDAKEKANEFAKEAKESASEFAEGAKETFASGENKKILAGVLGILFGGLGIHKFILGYNKEGGILLGATLIGILLSCVGIGILFVWIPGIVGFIEGIIYLTKSDAEFYNTYQAGKKPWF